MRILFSAKNYLLLTILLFFAGSCVSQRTECDSGEVCGCDQGMLLFSPLLINKTILLTHIVYSSDSIEDERLNGQVVQVIGIQSDAYADFPEVNSFIAGFFSGHYGVDKLSESESDKIRKSSESVITLSVDWLWFDLLRSDSGEYYADIFYNQQGDISSPKGWPNKLILLPNMTDELINWVTDSVRKIIIRNGKENELIP